MPMTKNRFASQTDNAITYRGYYILTNHDDSKLTVTANLRDALFITSSLCAAYAYVDNIIDHPNNAKL